MSNNIRMSENTGNSSQHIKAVVRVRPLSPEERDNRQNRIVISCVSLREIQTKEKKYVYDRVFDTQSTQKDVYSYVVAPMVKDVLAGYNCTVFAYGQTGTGKTHTMIGGEPDHDLAGCIPRAAAHIFAEIDSMNLRECSVRISFIELYNEEVRDLLSVDDRMPSLSVYNDSKGSVFVKNLNEFTVFSKHDIYQLLLRGIQKRQTASTLLNSQSSRSHTVFTITVHTREQADVTGEEVLKTGKINMVDLAGSENIAKSGAKDKRAVELANINRSLLTLGRVIHILTDKGKQHVPYRESKLTRILQDSLGGNTKTCIIATVLPSYSAYEETLSTLEYASRARDIRNTPTVNEKVTKAEMIMEMTHEIARLKRDLDSARSGDGFYIDRQNWEDLNSQLQSSSSALSVKNDILEETKKKLIELEEIKKIKEKEYEDVMEECKQHQAVINKAKNKLIEKQQVLKQEQFVSDQYFKVATDKHNVAKELFENATNLLKDHDVFRGKLENQYMNNHANENIMKECMQMLGTYLSSASDKVDRINSVTSTSISENISLIASLQNISHNFLNNAVKTRNDSRQLLESKFEEQNSEIRERSLNCLEYIQRGQDKMNEMLSIVSQSKESNRMVLSHYRSHLLEQKLGCENQIQSLESWKECLDNQIEFLKNQKQLAEDEQAKCRSKIGSIDSTLSEINQCLDRSEEELMEKRRRQSKFDLVHADLHMLNATLKDHINSLNSQKQYREEDLEKLLEVSKSMKEDIVKVIEDNSTKENLIKPSTSKLTILQEKTTTLEHNLVELLDELRSDLNHSEATKNEALAKFIPVKRTGDTPNNKPVVSKRLGEGALPRDILIKRFKEQYGEDTENDSSILNLTSDSLALFSDKTEGISQYSDVQHTSSMENSI